MTREEIVAYLVNEKEKYEARLDLLNKVAKAVAECRHHAAPSKKIATAFEKAHEGYSVFWDAGNQAKWEQRRLKVWGKGIKQDDGIEIGDYPDKFTWDRVFEQLRQQEGWFTKYIGQLNDDLEKVDTYLEWDRITKLSIKELEKDRPEVSSYMKRCFGEITVHENPASPR